MIVVNLTQEGHRFKRMKIRFTEALKEQARMWLERDKFSPEIISSQWENKNSKAYSIRPFLSGFGRQRKAAIRG